MPSPLARFLGTATGPAELRRRLRAAHKHLHEAAAVAGGLTRVSTQIPPAVFGGDLLSTLSDEMRNMLKVLDPDSGAAASRSRAVAAASSGASVTRSIRPVQPAISQLADHRRWPSKPAPDRLPGRPGFAGLQAKPEGTRSGFGKIGGDRDPAPTGPAGRREGTERANRRWPEAAPVGATPQVRPQAESSMLVSRVREYAELTRTQAHQQVTTPPADLPTVQRDTTLPPATASHHRFLWPDRASRAVAETLQRFTGASLSTPDDLGEVDAQLTRQSLTTSHPHHFGLRHGGDAADVGWLRDLSDRMADVLRTQALQHGIDLT
jgi:hypothetical protein